LTGKLLVVISLLFYCTTLRAQEIIGQDSAGCISLSFLSPVPLTDAQIRSIPFRLPAGEFYMARKLYPDGFNEIFDGDGKIIARGRFKNGAICTGFVSVYDGSGKFIAADLYKNGSYLCSSAAHQELTVYVDPKAFSDIIVNNRIEAYDVDPETMLKIMFGEE
jgi:hypothetical protein